MHIPDDPAAIASGLPAAKTTFDAIRSAIGLLKDTKDLLPKGQKADAVTAALVTAESSSRVAEAEIAKALGYELCRCEFPPTPMLTVGHISSELAARRGVQGPVYECPKCGFNTALSFSYSRIAPPRT
jgi:hypothetical protein